MSSGPEPPCEPLHFCMFTEPFDVHTSLMALKTLCQRNNSVEGLQSTRAWSRSRLCIWRVDYFTPITATHASFHTSCLMLCCTHSLTLLVKSAVSTQLRVIEGVSFLHIVIPWKRKSFQFPSCLSDRCLHMVTADSKQQLSSHYWHSPLS